MRGGALVASLAAVSAAPVGAQSPNAASMQQASRADLANQVSALEAQLASGALKGRNADDRFVITVRMDSVRADTASVRDSLKVSVLNLPELSLAGTLRSELNERVNSHIGRYVRNADARTSVLTRIAIFGAVARPGYYYASPDRPVSDIVMLAGGPAPNANLNEFQLVRARRTILDSKASRQAIKEGRTLEQLDVQSGDEFQIAQKRRVNWQLVMQLFFVVTSLTFAAVNFLIWYVGRQDN